MDFQPPLFAPEPEPQFVWAEGPCQSSRYSRADAIAAVELSRLPGVGAKGFLLLARAHGGPAPALDYWRGRLAQSPRLRRQSAAKTTPAAALEAARRFIEEGGLCLYAGGPGYPAALLAAPEPPPVLFCRGDPRLLALPAAAVVGTRAPSARGRFLASRCSRGLVRAGAAVVSGAALGVDGAAHRAALDEGGATIAVLACGADRVYPPEHAGLIGEIARRGLVLSELLPGTPPRRDFFPARNRIIAGLSRAVIIAEGRFPGGSWSTAMHAIRAGRPVFTPEGGPGSAQEDLARRVVRQGGHAVPPAALAGLSRRIVPGM